MGSEAQGGDGTCPSHVKVGVRGRLEALHGWRVQNVLDQLLSWTSGGTATTGLVTQVGSVLLGPVQLCTWTLQISNWALDWFCELGGVRWGQ